MGGSWQNFVAIGFAVLDITDITSNISLDLARPRDKGQCDFTDESSF